MFFLIWTTAAALAWNMSELLIKPGRRTDDLCKRLRFLFGRFLEILKLWTMDGRPEKLFF